MGRGVLFTTKQGNVFAAAKQALGLQACLPGRLIDRHGRSSIRTSGTRGCSRSQSSLGSAGDGVQANESDRSFGGGTAAQVRRRKVPDTRAELDERMPMAFQGCWHPSFPYLRPSYAQPGPPTGDHPRSRRA